MLMSVVVFAMRKKRALFDYNIGDRPRRKG
jgi:hypothetical protein